LPLLHVHSQNFENENQSIQKMIKTVICVSENKPWKWQLW